MENKVLRKSGGIALKGLVKNLRCDPVGFREIGVQHDTASTDGENERFGFRGGRGGFLFHPWKYG